jgi:tetratricopeptide (TPR) repeat protein
MNSKRFIVPLLALCLGVCFSALCSGKDQKSPLTVKRILFTSDKTGGEWITLFCNQSCTPDLFTLEDENPRVVMDMKGVLLIEGTTRNIDTGGKFIKRIRSYLNEQTKILRVVLDMEPSKNYIVCTIQDPFNNAYILRIDEQEQKPGGSGDDRSSSLSQEKRITILRPELKPGEQREGKPREIVTSPEKLDVAKTTKAPQSVGQGRLQMNAGDFAAAVETFTQVIVAHPQDSLSYRLRGNAYDNLGDRQKAMEDWIQAARLGDTIIQSYLDYQGVKWRETPEP